MEKQMGSIKVRFGKVMKTFNVKRGRFVSETRWRSASQGTTCLWVLESVPYDSYGWLNGCPEIRLRGTPKESVEARALEIHKALQSAGVDISSVGFNSYIFA